MADRREKACNINDLAPTGPPASAVADMAMPF
jgi:hypothetical protein